MRLPATIALGLLGCWLLALGSSGAARPRYTLKPVVQRLNQPVYVTSLASEPANVYVVQLGGLVRVLVNGKLAPRPFLDVRDLVSRQGERGLLPIAFPLGKIFRLDVREAAPKPEIVASS